MYFQQKSSIKTTKKIIKSCYYIIISYRIRGTYKKPEPSTSKMNTETDEKIKIELHSVKQKKTFAVRKFNYNSIINGNW